MNEILCSDWLPELARWRNPAGSGLPAEFCKKNGFLDAINKSFIGQACSVKMAGYCPRSFFACSLEKVNHDSDFCN